MSIKHFLFDHDDTLLPTFALRARVMTQTVQVTLNRSIDGAELMTASHGQSLEQMCAQLADGDPSLGEQLVREYRRRYYQANQQPLAPYPGITQLLTQLQHHGCRIGVVTSKLASGARGELERSGLYPFIEHLVGADDVTRPKPDPQPLEMAMHALGVCASETAMVGDTSADLLGAKAAGVTSIAALWGATRPDALLALSPDHAFDQPMQILDLL